MTITVLSLVQNVAVFSKDAHFSRLGIISAILISETHVLLPKRLLFKNTAA